MPADAADRMSSVVSLAAHCLGSPIAIRDFLTCHHILLGRRPIDAVMENSAGRDSVLKLLASIHAPYLPIVSQEK